MPKEHFEEWLADNNLRFSNLTQSARSIISSLLSEARIQHLSVEGRTKNIGSCIEKAKRKSYRRPQVQMTDICGIRIILFYESDIDKTCQLIENTFRIDEKNSLNRDDLLASNEVGYRSVHYVCDLGEDRCNLSEFLPFRDLKFELQVRTVLQHAWAELSHDRNYKFAGKLPRILERKLFLLAGMLEVVDAGFADLSREIDEYTDSISDTATDAKIIELNTLSLKKFFSDWAKSSGLRVHARGDGSGYSLLLSDLDKFGVKTLSDLKMRIPLGYDKLLKGKTAILPDDVWNWMIISDHIKFPGVMEEKLQIFVEDIEIFQNYLTDRQIKTLMKKITDSEIDVRARTDPAV